MKYILLLHGSQRDYDATAGVPGTGPVLSAEEVAAVGAFVEEFNRVLEESGELVDAQGLAAPKYTRQVRLRDGAPVVTDGPYAETHEVLAGYWIVECGGPGRVTEIAAHLSMCPGPESVIDIRPFLGSEDASGLGGAVARGTDVEEEP